MDFVLKCKESGGVTLPFSCFLPVAVCVCVWGGGGGGGGGGGSNFRLRKMSLIGADFPCRNSTRFGKAILPRKASRNLLKLSAQERK